MKFKELFALNVAWNENIDLKYDIIIDHTKFKDLTLDDMFNVYRDYIVAWFDGNTISLMYPDYY